MQTREQEILFPGFDEAEGVGFEPTVDRKAHNGFRDRPDRPLWHPSSNKNELYQAKQE